MASVRELSPDARTISALCAHLGGDEATRTAMRHYTASGPFGLLFDGVVPGYGDARWLTIEYDPIMQPNFPEGQLAFAACFHQVERERIAVGGHPKLVIVDEAWEPLGHPLFRNWITNMALTGRKLNMQLILCTQSVRHLDADHTAILLEQSPQRIFTSNPQATQDETARRYAAIGLSDTQIMLLATMRSKGEYLVMAGHVKIADLTLDDDAIRICGASRPTPDIAKARRLLAEGTDPGDPFLARWMDPNDVGMIAAPPRKRSRGKRLPALIATK